MESFLFLPFNVVLALFIASIVRFLTDLQVYCWHYSLLVQSDLTDLQVYPPLSPSEILPHLASPGAAVNALTLVEEQHAWLEDTANPDAAPRGGVLDGASNPSKPYRELSPTSPLGSSPRPSNPAKPPVGLPPTGIITLAELQREYAAVRALALLPDAGPATLWSTPEDALQRLLAEGAGTPFSM